MLRRPNSIIKIHIKPLQGIDIIKGVKLFGVMFSKRIQLESHVKSILDSCGQCSYNNKGIMDQGVSCWQLTVVLDAIILGYYHE